MVARLQMKISHQTHYLSDSRVYQGDVPAKLLVKRAFEIIFVVSDSEQALFAVPFRRGYISRVSSCALTALFTKSDRYYDYLLCAAFYVLSTDNA